MSGYLASLSAAEQLFAACAVVGGVLFAVRTIMNLIGGFDHDQGVDVHGGHMGGDTSGEADTSFRALSLQGITAFFMMFGLVGLALSQQTHTGAPFAALGGTLAGLLTVWVIACIFSSMQHLQADGTLHYENAIGQIGTVYLTIPATGRGQVSVPIQDQLRICEAVSADKVQLNTGERILVIDVNDSILVVSKAS